MNQSYSHRVQEAALHADNAKVEAKLEDEGNVSDDDQMVICEDPQPEIDLKCKDELMVSDNEAQDDDPEKKIQMYSTTGGGQLSEGVKSDITCRPKPIKGNFY